MNLRKDHYRACGVGRLVKKSRCAFVSRNCAGKKSLSLSLTAVGKRVECTKHLVFRPCAHFCRGTVLVLSEPTVAARARSVKSSPGSNSSKSGSGEKARPLPGDRPIFEETCGYLRPGRLVRGCELRLRTAARFKEPPALRRPQPSSFYYLLRKNFFVCQSKVLYEKDWRRKAKSK